jgi:3-dehydroquinate dehydratase / shikimate dehydrogenase
LSLSYLGNLVPGMRQPLLCATVTAKTMAELRRQRDAVAGVDLVELRLDAVADPDVAAALQGRRLPVILTCRSRREGGGFGSSEEDRHRILVHALDLGADFVDIEASAGFDDLVAAHRGRRIVLSMHDFGGIPRDLEERVRLMCRSGAEVVKVAVLTRELSDCARLLELSQRLPRDQAHVVIGMGDAGLPTRVLAARFGSAWTYAGDAVAPGQIPVSRMRSDLPFARVSEATAIYGLVGGPVMHSLSPAMHNAGFQALGIDAVYLPLAAASVDDFLRFAEVFDVRGASVTLPFKTGIFARLQAADPVSRRVGAVNTIRVEQGRWTGTNTDVGGFLQPLMLGSHGAPHFEGRAAILGAGGAARAVAVALASVGARVSVHARRTERAAEVAALVDGTAGPWPPAPGTWDLLVNATPVGMASDRDTPLPHYPFTSGTTVYDLIYNPAETRLVRDAAAAGCRTFGGLAMLVAQAERQFEWWTGQRAPDGLFREAAAGQLRDTAIPI